jgi:hypothetical protein
MRFPSIVSVSVAALAAVCSGCLHHDFTKDDPQPATNRSTQQLLDQIAAARQARHLPPPSIVPELRPPVLRGVVAVSRGDQSLATAAHDAGLRVVQIMGRHTWTFATDCVDLTKLQLPPLALESPELLMNAAAVPGPDGRTFVLVVVTEPGASSIRAEQMGGGGGGTNPSIESYVHPLVAPGRCGDRWPASGRS